MRGRMEGSHLAPDITASWAAPAAEASGTAALCRDAMRFTCQAPALEASGALFTRPPPLHAVKAVVTQARRRPGPAGRRGSARGPRCVRTALGRFRHGRARRTETVSGKQYPRSALSGISEELGPGRRRAQMVAAAPQAEATALAALRLEGCDLDVHLRALDVLPLLAPERGAPAGPQRLRLNGRAKFSGRLAAAAEPAGGAAGPATGAEGGPPAAGAAARGTAFAGTLTLDSLRVNQLKLARSLSGSLEVSRSGLQIHARARAPPPPRLAAWRERRARVLVRGVHAPTIWLDARSSSNGPAAAVSPALAVDGQVAGCLRHAGRGPLSKVRPWPQGCTAARSGVCSQPARRAQGARPDEALDLDLALPFSPAQASQAPAPSAPPAPPAAAQQPRRSPLAGLGDLLPVPRFGAQKLLPAGGASGASAAPAGAAEPAGGADSDGGGHFALRCGQLLISAEARRPA